MLKATCCTSEYSTVFSIASCRYSDLLAVTQDLGILLLMLILTEVLAFQVLSDTSLTEFPVSAKYILSQITSLTG